jgi:hypothetical protein
MDVALSIIQSSDGGYVVASWTSSFGASWDEDIYVVKMGPLGEICWSQGITNYSVSSGVGVSDYVYDVSVYSTNPTTSAVSPTVISVDASVITVCSSAGAPPLPMCYISGGCDYGSGMGVSSKDAMVELRRTTKGEGEGGKSNEEMKSYGCSVVGGYRYFLIVILLICVWVRFRKKKWG